MRHPIEQAVVRIFRAGEQRPIGSGFLVGSRTICTCAHVLSSRDEASTQHSEVNFPFLDSTRIPARVSLLRSASVDNGDLAFLGVDEALDGALELLTEEAAAAHSVEVYGFPVGYPEGVWANGNIGNRDARGWYEFVATSQLGFAVKAGFSGAPVWDKIRHGVMGMVVAVDTEVTTRVGFIIPADQIAKHAPATVCARTSGSIGVIDDEKLERWIWAARRLESPDPVAFYLSSLLPTRIDPIERYWIYIALGRIGGPIATTALQRARTSEDDRFALLGLLEALGDAGL